MKFTTLSTTDLRISKICLGTMSYGHQVAEADAHAQLDYAVGSGINFIDTAEMYPIPSQADTYGETERIIGRWLKKTGKRNEIVLASKVGGPNRYTHIRTGDNRLDKANIEAALDESLRRLQTDVIDLYQLHWPDRNVNYFGERGYVHQEKEQATPIEETLEALSAIVKSGKVRYVGLSNETPWGTLEFLRVAKEKNLPRMISVQNPYNLLNRHYDISMAEVSMRADIGLLAYSPLGYGVLGGRYLGGNIPKGGRFTLHPQFAARYRSPQVQKVTQLYADLAKKHGLSLAQMSLAFVNMQPFVTSNIIGASNLDQLKEDIETGDMVLSVDVLKGIEEIHEMYPNPVA
ncbi:MAG: NADP(H)-dependent aldo-keto reductase [Candidatus Peribacteraceae bacterium]|nr:NADP(H)-dependent aldo-keto reductase [Candidatus Peribacteraceae bacterium]